MTQKKEGNGRDEKEQEEKKKDQAYGSHTSDTHLWKDFQNNFKMRGKRKCNRSCRRDFRKGFEREAGGGYQHGDCFTEGNQFQGCKYQRRGLKIGQDISGNQYYI